MKKKLIIDCVFLFLIGCITSLSLPPYNYFFVNFFTLTSIFIFLIKKSKIHKNKNLFFFYGWIFGFGFFMTNLYWISYSLTFDENFKFLIPFALILVPSFLALFYGFICYLFIQRRGGEINEDAKKLEIFTRRSDDKISFIAS